MAVASEVIDGDGRLSATSTETSPRAAASLLARQGARPDFRTLRGDVGRGRANRRMIRLKPGAHAEEAETARSGRDRPGRADAPSRTRRMGAGSEPGCRDLTSAADSSMSRPSAAHAKDGSRRELSGRSGVLQLRGFSGPQRTGAGGACCRSRPGCSRIPCTCPAAAFQAARSLPPAPSVSGRRHLPRSDEPEDHRARLVEPVRKRHLSAVSPNPESGQGAGDGVRRDLDLAPHGVEMKGAFVLVEPRPHKRALEGLPRVLRAGIPGLGLILQLTVVRPRPTRVAAARKGPPHCVAWCNARTQEWGPFSSGLVIPALELAL